MIDDVLFLRQVLAVYLIVFGMFYFSYISYLLVIGIKYQLKQFKDV